MKNKLTGKRLFAFGDSLTYYNYPTWADILGYHYPFYENWGKAGSGNGFILSSVIECDKRNNFTPDDDIIITWSAVDRFDFYQHTNWSSKIGAYPHNDPFSCCPDGYELMSTIYKSACHGYLKNKSLKFKSLDPFGVPLNSDIEKLFSSDFEEIEQVSMEINEKKTKRTDFNAYQDFLVDLYRKQAGADWPTLNQIMNSKHEITDPHMLKEIEDFKERIYYHTDWDFDSEVVDWHPSPLQHMDFVRKQFSEFTISEDCVRWVTEIQNQIDSGTYRGFTPFKPKERF